MGIRTPPNSKYFRARETNGGHTFQFQVTDPALLRGLRVGAPVYANFDTKQVSLDGKKAMLHYPEHLHGRKTASARRDVVRAKKQA